MAVFVVDQIEQKDMIIDRGTASGLGRLEPRTEVLVPTGGSVRLDGLSERCPCLIRRDDTTG